MSERRLSPSDASWLYSEWEKNNQTVSAVMWLDREIDPDVLTEILQERLVDQYPTFHRRLRTSRNPLYMPHWTDDEDFDIAHHVDVLRLPAPGTKEQLAEVIGEQRSQMLDRSRPLWKFHVIQGYQGNTTAIHARIQHSIADGWALVRLVMSLCDESAELQRPEVVEKQRRRKRDVLAQASAPAVEAVSRAADVVRNPGQLDPEGLADSLTSSLGPDRFREFGSDLADLAKELVGGTQDAVNFLNSPRPGKTILHGDVSGVKKVAWIDPIPLQPIKDFGQSHGATINDVLLGALTNALRTYLLEKDALTVDYLFTTVPVSLRKADDPLPRTLGNRFGLIPVMLPVGLADPLAQIQDIKQQMDEMKSSQMPIVSFGLASAASITKPDIQQAIHKLNQAHSIGVTTNVPGPRHAIYLAGADVLGCWGMGGLSGNMNLSFGIFTLNGELNFSVHSDRAITEDPERILDHFLASIAALGDTSGG